MSARVHPGSDAAVARVPPRAWAASLLTITGLILGGMSLLRLIELGLGYRFGATMSALLHGYDGVVRAIVEVELPWWTGPLVLKLVDLVRGLGADFDLHPHWRHVFVLLGLLFLPRRRL